MDLDSFSHVWDSNCAITAVLSTLCPCEKSARNPRFIDLRLSIYPSFLLLVHILVHHTGTIQKLNLWYRVSQSDVRSWISFHEFNIPDAVACNADTNSHARYVLSLFKSIIDLVIWYGKLVVWRNSRGREEKYPLAKLYGALKLSKRRKKKREFGEYQEFCRRRGRRRAGELLYIHEFVTSPGYLARPNFLPFFRTLKW